MVSTLSRQEKFNQARRNFCFYLDIPDHGLCRSISRRLQDMGLQQESCLSSRVTHVVRSLGSGAAAAAPGAAAGPGPGPGAGPRWRREAARARADAMLQRVHNAPTQHNYVLLSVEKAIALLDKLYDTFFTAPRKPNVRFFTKHFIKIEFLDKQCRPLYKEFDEWPDISLEPNPVRERKEKKETTIHQGVTVNNNYQNTIGQNQDMTRKNRPRIKEKEDAEPVGGYCEACGAMFSDLAAHARSPRHAAFARDTNNFLALDSLIGGILPVNGERRSLRNMCNGDRVNGTSPRNGALDDEPRRTRRKTDSQEDRQYYKVVGVSTKLRSSGGFAKRKEESPTCNGAKPLVVKFRKVRRSELSMLSDEAEQFMFPKRASSTSSTSSGDDDDEEEKESPRRKTPPQPSPALERRRQARPTALKEESSEEDSWLDDKRRRKRRVVTVVRRTRRAPCKPPTPEPEPPPEPEISTPVEIEICPEPEPEPEVSPLREEPVEKCMKWEDGKLKYTPAVEQLEFAFESVPRSEPWFETFTRQDHDQVAVRNVPRCFALYSKSPKLPYEIGQLPPLKPDCCPLSALPLPRPAAREPVSERYGTRGLKTRRLHKRVAAVAALDSRPRKSPREHASTLAMLGSAGLHRRRPDDAKSTASEDTVSDVLSAKPEPSEAREADERLQKFLSEVFDDAAEYELDEMDGGALPAAAAPPDVLGLVSECDGCDIIRNEIAENAERRRERRRGRVKKKNRTGWPNKKKAKKGSRTTSSEKTESTDRSSVASDPADDTCDEEPSEKDDEIAPKVKSDDEIAPKVKSDDEIAAKVKSDEEPEAMEVDGKEDDEPLRLDVKVLLQDKKKEKEARSSVSEDGEERGRKKKRALTNLASWLQPVVRVARVDAAARRLRSGAKPRPPRLR